MNESIDERKTASENLTAVDRQLRTIGFSVATGGAMAVLALVVCVPDVGGTIGGGLFIALIIGLFCGLLCAPVFAILAWGRDETIFRPACAWMTIATVYVVSYTDYHNELVHGAGIVVGAFLLMAVMMRLCLPRIWRGDGICRACGYDLRESVEIGRCPECGRMIYLPLWYAGLSPDKWERRIKGTMVLIFRHPLVVTLLIVAAMLVRYLVMQVEEENLRRQIVEAFQTTVEAQKPFVLSEVTPFEWDRVHVFGGYTSTQRMEASLGLRWRAGGIFGVGLMEGSNFLVFVRDGQVVGCAKLSLRDIFWGEVQLPMVLTPNDAVFLILPSPNNWSGPELRRTADDYGQE